MFSYLKSQLRTFRERLMSRGPTHCRSAVPLIDIRFRDSSRHFVSLPMSEDWYGVRDHVAKLNGAELTGFVTDELTEAWIDFRYRSQTFAINNQWAEYWFFVDHPDCPDEILHEVVRHFANLLGSD